jgi:hypothetical protein
MVKRDHLFFSASLNATDNKSSKTQSNRNRGTFHNTQNKKEPWQFKCWVCQKDDHIIRDCKISREKDGKEIHAMACKLKICTNCGKEKYVKGKPCTGKKTPSECRKCPGKNHWATFCPNRLGAKQSATYTHKSSNEKKKAQVNINQSDIHTDLKAIDYPNAIEYVHRPMIMAPIAKQNLHTASDNSEDDGSEFVANNHYISSRVQHPNAPPNGPLHQGPIDSSGTTHMTHMNRGFLLNTDGNNTQKPK